MFRPLFALLLAAAPAGAAFAQAETEGSWALAPMPNGCMLQATSPQGTMLSIWAFAGQDKLAFLLQNREWGALHDGEDYKLDLDFLGVRALPVQATARRNIDEDGPGLFFTVKPGSSALLDALTSAKGMRITQDGRSFDTLPLAGSRVAMAGLARCLAARWAAGAPVPAEPPKDEAPAVETI